MVQPNRFDLNLLTVFDAIYSHGGVSQAARHLNLTQSAVSHTLARLREAFGDPLFVRQGNAMTPTAAARNLVQPVRDALRSIDMALGGAAAFDPATSTRLFRIGLRPATEVPLLASLVEKVLALAPQVSIWSTYLRRERLDRVLESGALDVALDVQRQPSPGTRSISVERGALAVVVREGHPLVGDALDLPTYLALDHVFVSPRSAGLGLEDVALAGLGHERRIRIRCQHAISAWQIVAGSDFICTLPRSHAVMLQAIHGLRLFPLPFEIAPSELRLFWHEARDADPALRWLREVIEAHFAQVGELS
ncbi:MAG TPA: LysR family transcriptional regulator [Allosphingosinicella sp.]|nr:LysR family transcriptional regulator [Allosphingosinicella sp.]